MSSPQDPMFGDFNIDGASQKWVFPGEVEIPIAFNFLKRQDA